MSVKIKGREYDFAAECLSCPGGPMGVFGTKADRQAWVIQNHFGHEVDYHLQGRV